MINKAKVVNNHFNLGNSFYHFATPAKFPRHILRFRNDRAAKLLDLDHLSNDQWVKFFGQFDKLPGIEHEPLALKYHGHQFGHYNPDLGDGRGFLLAQFLDKNNYCRGCLENKTKRIQEKQKEINKILEEEGDGDFFIINPNKKPFERPVAHFFHKDEIAAEELLKDYGIMSRRRTLKDKLYQTQPYFRVQVKKDPEDYMEGVIPRKVNTRNFVDDEGEEHLVIKDLPPLIINRKTNSDSKK